MLFVCDEFEDGKGEGRGGAVSELVSEINEGIYVKKAEPQVSW